MSFFSLSLFSLHPPLFRLTIFDSQLNLFTIMLLQNLPSLKEPDYLKSAQEDAFAKVNALLFRDISTKLKVYPSMDMADLLEQKCKTYPALRLAFCDEAIQSAMSAPGASRTEPMVGSSDARDGFQIPANTTVIQPFKATLFRVVQQTSSQTNSDSSTFIEGLNRLIVSCEIIWHLGSTAVLGLNSELIMKVGYDIDINHIQTLDYIKQQAPHTPVPKIYGILRQSDSKRIFLFMSRLPGEPLDSKWKQLSTGQKTSIKVQLEAIVADFRSIPAPTEGANAVLGGGNPRRCKDTRKHVRIAPGPICNEIEFNKFLTSNPTHPEDDGIAMIKSYLDTNHKIVMTHGDLHPRNIMVTINPRSSQEPLNTISGTSNLSNSRVTVTGIVDWEMCGWYPEYWEYVKALNTISIGGDFGDWWSYLPSNIGVWPKEHAVDVMLSRWHG